MTDRGSALIEVIAASAVLALGASTGLMAWSHLGDAGARVRQEVDESMNLVAVSSELRLHATRGTLCDAVSEMSALTVALEPDCDDSGPWQVWLEAEPSGSGDTETWWVVIP
jgi:hypothetical protein